MSQLSGVANLQTTLVRIGKYQLLQASVESGRGKGLQTVLRIDTETGETWVLLAEDPPKWKRLNDPDLSNNDIDPLKLFSPEENEKHRKEQEKAQR
ncbi:MAG: hypothetical protein HY282_17985 [Nitrospirae bacterium]|nr:hypothetical protein [Candidatus Manganitrophaceae bacterium]